MSRIELDCKNYKRFVHNKFDRSCKKLLNKARIRSAQGLSLKNAEINMMRATCLTKVANIPKLIDGGHIERACLLTDVINNN